MKIEHTYTLCPENPNRQVDRIFLTNCKFCLWFTQRASKYDWYLDAGYKVYTYERDFKNMLKETK